jgi:hypothetical protein
MQLRHITPRSIDWMDAMDEGNGGRGWEKLGPEERSKLRREVQPPVRQAAQAQAQMTAGRMARMGGGQGFEPTSPSR